MGGAHGGARCQSRRDGRRGPAGSYERAGSDCPRLAATRVVASNRENLVRTNHRGRQRRNDIHSRLRWVVQLPRRGRGARSGRECPPCVQAELLCFCRVVRALHNQVPLDALGPAVQTWRQSAPALPVVGYAGHPWSTERSSGWTIALEVRWFTRHAYWYDATDVVEPSDPVFDVAVLDVTRTVGFADDVTAREYALLCNDTARFVRARGNAKHGAQTKVALPPLRVALIAPADAGNGFPRLPAPRWLADPSDSPVLLVRDPTSFCGG